MNDELTPAERAALRARILGGAHDIKPVGAYRGAWIAGSVATALVVAIAGGVAVTSTLSAPPVATTPSPSATATAAPIRTATPTPVPSRQATSPASRIPFGCEEVAPRVAPFFDGSVPTVASTRPVPRGNLWTPGPMEWSFAQAGALYCEFGEFDAAWAVVAIVPDAEGAIEDRDSISGGGCGGGLPCELINGTYLSVEGATDGPARGDEDAVLAQASWDTLRDDVLAAPPSASNWRPPTNATLLTRDCAGILPATRAAEILGVPEMRIETDFGGWSIESWMLDGYWKASFCQYLETVEDPFMNGRSITVVWLPGGEWAYRKAATGEAIPATGGRTTDTVRMCASEIAAVTYPCADILVDGNWVRVSLPSAAEEADNVTTAARVAQALYETVYG